MPQDTGPHILKYLLRLSAWEFDISATPEDIRKLVCETIRKYPSYDHAGGILPADANEQPTSGQMSPEPDKSSGVDNKKFVVLSLEEMVELASSSKAALVSVFWCDLQSLLTDMLTNLSFGRHPRDNRHIIVNLYASSIARDIVKPFPTIDFDSLIWVTPQLRTRGTVSIYNVPQSSKSQEWHLKTNNHIQVQLVAPPAVDGDPFEAQQLKPPTYLSHIPHVDLGRLGHCDKPMNLLLFFPRMMHRNTHGQHITWIGASEQRDLWNHVILPALVQCHAKGQEPYVVSTVEEHRARHGPTKTTYSQVQANDIPRFVYNMRKIISNNHLDGDDSLAHFGSFFFVLEGRGFKNLTMQELKSAKRVQDDTEEQLKCHTEEGLQAQETRQRRLAEIAHFRARQDTLYMGDEEDLPPPADDNAYRLVPEDCPDLAVDNTSPMAKLERAFPFLDIPFMKNRELSRGEFYLDFGVSFHPSGEQTGLWKTDALGLSFQKAGIANPNVKEKNTLQEACSMIGSPDYLCTMKTGIFYRQDYCLEHEIIRSFGKNYDLFKERDAAHLTGKFFTEIDKLIALYEGEEKANIPAENLGLFKGRLGVRIEHRVTAAVALDILENCLWQVRDVHCARRID